jgi:hypothetical protein
MLTAIPDLPDGVLGFEASGKLEASDYTDVLDPALRDAGDEIRLVLVIPDFDGIAAEAVWADAKMGVKRWGDWTRVAFVTDAEWMIRATKWFGWMSPGELKHFHLADRAAAVAWAAG